jgi:hypothetical protein
MRFVGEKLVIRLETMLTAERLEGLNAEFSDILNGGVIEPTDPLSVEVNDEDALDKPRLRMNFDRASYGRLRELVDRLNETG